MTEVDLATARSHVQQFKEISQANEEALSNLKTTYDDYKTSTEAQLAHHEVCVDLQTINIFVYCVYVV